MFAVQGEGQVALLVVQFDTTLFHCLLQGGEGLEHGLHRLGQRVDGSSTVVHS